MLKKYCFTTQSGHCLIIAVLLRYGEKSMHLEDSLVHDLNFWDSAQSKAVPSLSREAA